MKIRYFIDVSPLTELRFTGIANVVCKLVEWFDRNKPDSTHYFMGQTLFERAQVLEAVTARNGRNFRSLREFGTFQMVEDVIRGDPYWIDVGLFGGIKTARSVFDYEAQMAYDLTFLVVPEMHSQNNVRTYASTIQGDVDSNDLNICISDWTRMDLISYVGADESKCMVSHLACDPQPELPRLDIEPYYLMLGTIEPRKNHALVLRAVKERPELLKDRKLVIAGRTRWGQKFEDLVAAFGLEHMLDRQIFQLGFCSDETRDKLLRNATAVLYPSIYEGFGLPILEAMAVGTPVVTSRSSSLPEVGGDAVFYIDPFSVDDLAAALASLDAAMADPAAKAALEERMRRQLAKFSWDGFCSRIVARIESDVVVRRTDAAGAKSAEPVGAGS